MGAKKPLVITAGQIEQLQSGDYLSVPISGYTEIVATNDEASPIVIGAPVYMDAADGVKKAKADASGTSMVTGLVADTSIANGVSGGIAVDGVLTATTAQWDAVAGTTGGLTFGTRYYLSAGTAGILTATAPTTAGQYVVLIGIALSTTELKLMIQPRILL
jgi:hypothetical protein